MKKRKRNRMVGYDYSMNNLYFVTICVKNMECCFGEILSAYSESKSKKMYLNEIGEIAKIQWDWLENQYPYIKVHTFIIMPNHIHGIIEIDRNLIINKNIKIKSLSSLMGAYKMTTSKLIHLSGFHDFSWHRSFYDHIIRSENAYENIFNYIKMNPDKWVDDKYNTTQKS
ncbi:MAG TPA: transposase [Lutibacter sp.]